MMSRFRVRMAAMLLIAGTLLGCGSSIMNPLSLPNRLYGKDGQVLYLDDLEDIANDPALTDEEKKQAFRELGIEDERLVEALLDL